jgi:hypothetical protein
MRQAEHLERVLDELEPAPDVGVPGRAATG